MNTDNYIFKKVLMTWMSSDGVITALDPDPGV